MPLRQGEVDLQSVGAVDRGEQGAGLHVVAGVHQRVGDPPGERGAQPGVLEPFPGEGDLRGEPVDLRLRGAQLRGRLIPGVLRGHPLLEQAGHPGELALGVLPARPGRFQGGLPGVLLLVELAGVEFEQQRALGHLAAFVEGDAGHRAGDLGAQLDGLHGAQGADAADRLRQGAGVDLGRTDAHGGLGGALRLLPAAGGQQHGHQQRRQSQGLTPRGGAGRSGHVVHATMVWVPCWGGKSRARWAAPEPLRIPGPYLRAPL